MIDELANCLNSKQCEICLSQDNYLIMACPGSGKTRTLTYRLAYIADKYKKSEKYNIAITYTNRAANEIENRLLEMGVEMDNVWTGTIHQFCMKFIIRPYAMYSERLKKGYTIIDEYISDSYCRKIAKELGIQCNFSDNPLDYPKVKEEYEKLLKERKEIDFEQILILSEELVCKNKFIAENISKIIRSIQVDEFQDTQEEQYQILAAIVKNNKSINIAFVGDVNQAIYGSLGGIAKNLKQLEQLFQVNIKEEYLSGCYRSTQRIVDYYKNFEIVDTGVFCSRDELKNEKGIIYLNNTLKKNELLDYICNIINKELKLGVPEEEICIAAPQWGLIFEISEGLKKKMPNQNFDAPEISPFKRDPLNPFYLLAKLVYTEPGTNTYIRKKIANEILEILKEEYHISMDEKIDLYYLLRSINSYKNYYEDGMNYFESCVKYVLLQVKIDLKNETELNNTFEAYIQKSKNRIKKYKIENTNVAIKTCFHERHGIVLSTIHGIKGEEYTTVIAFGLLNGYLPYWNYLYDNEKKRVRNQETKKLLYVLGSRAKKKLYLFSERGRTTKNGNDYTMTDELRTVSYEYDQEEGT